MTNQSNQSVSIAAWVETRIAQINTAILQIDAGKPSLGALAHREALGGALEILNEIKEGLAAPAAPAIPADGPPIRGVSVVAPAAELDLNDTADAT